MKLQYLYIVLILVLDLEVNGQKTINYYNDSISVDINNVPLDRNQYYFPAALFPKVDMVWKETSKDHFLITPKVIENSVDSSSLVWFSRFLYEMNEPLLFNRPLRKEIYRLTILRTFHNPIMLRIEKDSDEYYIYWKVTDGKGGYEPGTLIIDNWKRIDKSTWQGFKNKLDSMQFWTMKRSTSWGTDGSEWILEGTNSNQYHVVSIWSPGKNGIFHKFFIELLKSTNIEIKEDEIY